MPKTGSAPQQLIFPPYPPESIDLRVTHGWVAQGLIALILGHALAALYHHYARKDGLLGRMGFSRRY